MARCGGRLVAGGRPASCSRPCGCLARPARPAAPALGARRTWRLSACSSTCRRRQTARRAAADDGPGAGERGGEELDASQPQSAEQLDTNQLQTALNNAIAAEDYAAAAQLSARLRALQGAGELSLDWRSVGVPDWLAERAEQLQFRFPTEVQRRCCAAVQGGGHDVVVQSETGSGKTLAFLMPLLSLLDYPPQLYPDDLRGPQLIVLVPSLELGVQTALLVYKLFGGSVNPGIPGASANMFAYSGPRGLKVRGVLTEEELEMSRQPGFLSGTHVLVSTPGRLAELARLPEAAELFTDLKALAVDEVDACFQEDSAAMEQLLGAACAQPGARKPTVAFVGATLSDSLADQACQMGWLVDPIMLLPAAGSAGNGKARVPAGLQHRFIRVPAERKLAALCRQLRADLQTQGEDAPPPRVIVFAGSEAAAAAAADPLRTALWGQHRLAVLLPHGEEPIKAMHSFRDNAATFLLATPAAARGLDMPAVSHVYSLDCPDAVEYLHRAGRAGRIGSPVKGVVTTLVTPEEEPALQAVAAELGLQLQEQPEIAPGGIPDPEADIDSAKRTLEDLFNLL